MVATAETATDPTPTPPVENVVAEVVAPPRPEPLPLWQALQIRNDVRLMGHDLSYRETRKANRQEIRASASSSIQQAEYERRFLEARAVSAWLACPFGTDDPEEIPDGTDPGDAQG